MVGHATIGLVSDDQRSCNGGSLPLLPSSSIRCRMRRVERVCVKPTVSASRRTIVCDSLTNALNEGRGEYIYICVCVCVCVCVYVGHFPGTGKPWKATARNLLGRRRLRGRIAPQRHRPSRAGHCCAALSSFPSSRRAHSALTRASQQGCCQAGTQHIDGSGGCLAPASAVRAGDGSTLAAAAGRLS